MKLLIVAITFAATLGTLFLIEAGKSPQKDYAQIVEALKEGKVSAVASVTPVPIKTRVSTPTPASTPIPTPTLTPSPAPQNGSTTKQTPATPTPTQTSTKTPSPTLLPISPSSSPALSETPPPPTPTPSSPPQEAGQGFINIASITSPVEQNSTAQLSISTLPDAQCSIKVTLPSGSQSTAKGLEAKTADTSGNTAWSWKINWNTTTGTATIEINCSKDSQNFSKSLQMAIVER